MGDEAAGIARSAPARPGTHRHGPAGHDGTAGTVALAPLYALIAIKEDVVELS